jgi:hypothetical protein
VHRTVLGSGHSLFLNPGDADFRNPTTPVVVSMGGADFHIAMTDMLLAGFPVANTGQVFPPLRPDQVAIGLPAANSAGNGFTAPDQVHAALNCLARGQGCGGVRPARRPRAGIAGSDDVVHQLGPVLQLGIREQPRAVPQRLALTGRPGGRRVGRPARPAVRRVAGRWPTVASGQCSLTGQGGAYHCCAY